MAELTTRVPNSLILSATWRDLSSVAKSLLLLFRMIWERETEYGKKASSGIAFPPRLAPWTCLRHFRRARKELEDAGFIHRTTRKEAFETFFVWAYSPNKIKAKSRTRTAKSPVLKKSPVPKKSLNRCSKSHRTGDLQSRSIKNKERIPPLPPAKTSEATSHQVFQSSVGGGLKNEGQLDVAALVSDVSNQALGGALADLGAAIAEKGLTTDQIEIADAAMRETTAQYERERCKSSATTFEQIAARLRCNLPSNGSAASYLASAVGIESETGIGAFAREIQRSGLEATLHATAELVAEKTPSGSVLRFLNHRARKAAEAFGVGGKR